MTTAEQQRRSEYSPLKTNDIMNKYMKIFLLAAVLVGTTVSIASCDKDELNAPHHNGGAGK